MIITITKTITDLFLFIMELLANIEVIYNIYFSGYLQNIIMLFNNKKIVPLEYIYVKDGYEIYKSDNVNNVMTGNVDFIIEKKWNDNDEIFYGRIKERIQDFISNDKNNYNKLFMSVTLLYNDENYDIDLESPINFYVEGNILLDYSFVNWYVRTHYNFSIDQCESYEIVLIDDSMNVTNMSNISYIELSDKKYNLSNVSTPE